MEEGKEPISAQHLEERAPHVVQVLKPDKMCIRDSLGGVLAVVLAVSEFFLWRRITRFSVR